MSELKPNRHRNPKLSNRVKKDEPTVEEMLESAKLADKKKNLYILMTRTKQLSLHTRIITPKNSKIIF